MSNQHPPKFSPLSLFYFFLSTYHFLMRSGNLPIFMLTIYCLSSLPAHPPEYKLHEGDVYWFSPDACRDLAQSGLSVNICSVNA